MPRKAGKHTGEVITRKNGRGSWKVGELLGSGNEGEVYLIENDPNYAAKVYKEGKAPSKLQTAKLRAMEGKITPELTAKPSRPALTWPEQIITNSGSLVGFVMPRIELDQIIPIGQYCNPSVRQKVLAARGIRTTGTDEIAWAAIRNLTHTARKLHKNDYLIGDVNERNILIDPVTGDVTIVDCDSFQIHDPVAQVTYNCNVGRPEYTAPELLRQMKGNCDVPRCPTRPTPHLKQYRCITRTEQHDLFGIAVIIFKLLMDGAHPYDCKITSTRGPQPTTLKERIELDYYPYGKKAPHNIQPLPKNAESYNNLPLEVRNLFQRAFADNNQ